MNTRMKLSSGDAQRPGTGRKLLWMGTLVAAAVAASTNVMAQAGYQAGEWAKVVAAAKKEGKVVWYSATPVDLGNKLLAAFRKSNPDIQVEFTRGPSGGLMGKIDRERTTGVDGADVFVTTERPWMLDRTKDGGMLPLNGPSSAAYPAKYIYGSGAVASVGISPLVIMYNTKLVSVPPTGYKDLLRPEFKNRTAGNELAGTVVMAWCDWLEKTQGADFLHKMRAQNPKLYNGGGPIGQAVASGEAAIGTFGIPTNVSALKAAGAPVNYVVPNPGLGVEFVVGAMGWAKRPNAARVFADFMMSREAQTIWHGEGTSASPLTGIPGSLKADGITAWDSSAWPKERADQYRIYWNKIFK